MTFTAASQRRVGQAPKALGTYRASRFARWLRSIVLGRKAVSPGARGIGAASRDRDSRGVACDASRRVFHSVLMGIAITALSWAVVGAMLDTARGKRASITLCICAAVAVMGAGRTE